jgi:hypothetical protein
MSVVANAALLLILAVAAPTASAFGRLHSIAPASGYFGAYDAWLYFDHTLSVDCSPPRGCYAKTQWVQAYVDCHRRFVAIVQTISMDLNGNVVGHAIHDPPQFAPAYGHGLRSYMQGRAGDALYLVCGHYPERD